MIEEEQDWPLNSPEAGSVKPKRGAAIWDTEKYSNQIARTTKKRYTVNQVMARVRRSAAWKNPTPPSLRQSLSLQLDQGKVTHIVGRMQSLAIRVLFEQLMSENPNMARQAACDLIRLHRKIRQERKNRFLDKAVKQHAKQTGLGIDEARIKVVSRLEQACADINAKSEVRETQEAADGKG